MHQEVKAMAMPYRMEIANRHINEINILLEKPE